MPLIPEIFGIYRSAVSVAAQNIKFSGGIMKNCQDSKKLFFILFYLVLIVSCTKSQNADEGKKSDVFAEFEISKTVNQKPGVWKKDYAADEFGDNTNDIIYTQLMTNCEGSAGMMGNLQCGIIAFIPKETWVNMMRAQNPKLQYEQYNSNTDSVLNTVLILGFGIDTNQIILSAKMLPNDIVYGGSFKPSSACSLHIKDYKGKIHNFNVDLGYKESEFIPSSCYIGVVDNIDGGISFFGLFRNTYGYKFNFPQ
jgi:hypothetical protein